jgi:hypothetical protein
MSRFVIFHRTVPFLCLLALASAGCGTGGNARYIPGEDSARQALEAALTAWKNGQAKPGAIPDSSPPVNVVDSRWQAGDRLQAFEVLEEEPNAGGARVFSVRLTMSASEPSRTVRYYVWGVDPLWVSREEDAQQPAGM